ncbi:MAG: hypothetical protein ACOY3P_10900 [Planctomycetota bacterium]
MSTVPGPSFGEDQSVEMDLSGQAGQKLAADHRAADEAPPTEPMADLPEAPPAPRWAVAAQGQPFGSPKALVGDESRVPTEAGDAAGPQLMPVELDSEETPPATQLPAPEDAAASDIVLPGELEPVELLAAHSAPSYGMALTGDNAELRHEEVVEPEASQPAIELVAMHPQDAELTEEGSPEPPANRVAHRDTAPRAAERVDLAPPSTLRAPEAPADATAADDSRSTAARWPESKMLLAMLADLATHDEARYWAVQTSGLLVDLSNAASDDMPRAGYLVRELARKLGEIPAIEARARQREVARKARRVGFAMMRRLAVWQESFQSRQAVDEDQAKRETAYQLALAVDQVEQLVGDTPEGIAWRSYLLTDALRAEAERSTADDETFPQDLAEMVLQRLSRTDLSPGQQHFVASRPVVEMDAALRRLAADRVDADAILAHLEQYEADRLPSSAHRLGADCQRLGLALAPWQHRLEEHLQTHYRNANLRVVVSQSLVNRVMPKREPELMPVYDTVLGLPVYGQSLMTTEVAVRLIPDPNRVRLALEVQGHVTSNTLSDAGPATFYNTGNADYVAVRPMEINMQGIRLESVDVAVDNQIRLRRVETDLDGIPLFGSLAKSIATQQHEMKRDAARREMRWKVANQAQQRIETESTERLTEFAHRFHARVLGPLRTLQLDPTIVDAETTAERLTMRLRLAGADQLGSHTPRPQAPADSLASVQVHESALNNALERLELNGRTFSLPELSKHVASRLGREPWDHNPENDDVFIAFAAEDAAHVHCEEGQLVLTLAVAGLSKGPRAWRNFQVRAFYRPQVNGCQIELQREGVIHLIGSLNLGSQIALRGIFTKTFSRKTPWNLTPESVTSSPNISDLAITQFTIDDGWIAVALGPKRQPTAVRPMLLRR